MKNKKLSMMVAIIILSAILCGFANANYIKQNESDEQLEINTYAVKRERYIFKLSDFTIVTWVLIVINIVSYGLMITAFVLCIKTKIRFKAIWMILIFFQTGITFCTYYQYSGNMPLMQFSFFKLFGLSFRFSFPDGNMLVTRVIIHVFAIVFLILRKKLNKNYLTRQEIIKARLENQQRYQKEQEIKEAELLKEKENVEI